MVSSRSVGCPWCGSPNVDTPMVDIGVGEIQCGPASCMDCQSYQINPSDQDQFDQVSPEEQKLYWIKGPDVEVSKKHWESLNGTVR